MARRSTHNDPFPYQREGFWRHPREKKCPLPVPVPNDKPWPGKKVFLKALRKLEKRLDKEMPPRAYKGSAPCRLCRKANGSREYVDTRQGWTWPSGFAHYVKVHNVRPSLAFQEFVVGRRINACD